MAAGAIDQRSEQPGSPDFMHCRLATREARENIARQAGERKKHHGSEIREHGDAEAMRLIEAGLKRERLSREELAALAKGDPRKARLQPKCRGETAVPLRWRTS